MIPARPRRPRRPTTARARLTVSVALVVLGVGAAVLLAVFVVVSYVPRYEFAPTPGQDLPALGGGAPSIAPDPTGGSSAGSPVVTVDGTGELRAVLLTTCGIVFGATLIVGTIASWIVAGRVLRPLDRLTEAAREAAEGRLHHRIGTGDAAFERLDEFGRLGRTFDEMLDRLQRSFEAQRRFAANASHELRTPLATSQALLDVALLDPGAVDAARLVERLRETNTRNVETVEALLALSDAESGLTRPERIELDDVAYEVVASTVAAAEERDVTLHSSILAGAICGEATLVRLLVSNLLSNAVRYNSLGGEVWLTVARGEVRVENTGPVVADVNVPRLIEPFFRPAGRVAGSHGLGLALVDAIARAHGADLAVAARPEGGLAVSVRFSAA